MQLRDLAKINWPGSSAESTILATLRELCAEALRIEPNNPLALAILRRPEFSRLAPEPEPEPEPELEPEPEPESE